MEWIKKNKTLLILLLIMFLSSIWLINKGMPYQHDGDFHSSRLLSLARTIKNGDFLALIHDGYYGYGYANGIFYSNFFFYINAFLINIGMSTMTSFKLLNVFINIGTILSIYFVSKSISKDKKISIMITILYMFSLYRMVDVYVRGAIGETLAFMIIPVVLLGLYEIVYRDYKKWYIFTIGFVLLLLSHLITSFLMAIFIVIFLLFNYKSLLNDKKRIKYLFLSGLVGVLLGLFFILTLLEQYKAGYIQIFIDGTPIYLEEEVVSFKEFLIPTDLFNKNLGLSLILLIPIRFFIKTDKVKNIELLKYADIFFILGIFSWIFTTSIFPWKNLSSVLGFMQFPWRLLTIATSFMIFSYIIYFMYLKDNKKIIKYSYIVILLFSIITLGLYSYQYGYKNYHYPEHNDNSIGGGEYLPSGINFDTLFTLENGYRITGESLEITDYKKDGTTVHIMYKNASKDDYIEIPLFNYLGYKAYNANIETGENGLIKLYPNKEEGSIKVYYSGTNITKVSYVVSTVTALVLLTYIFIERKKKNGIS